MGILATNADERVADVRFTEDELSRHVDGWPHDQRSSDVVSQAPARDQEATKELGNVRGRVRYSLA